MMSANSPAYLWHFDEFFFSLMTSFFFYFSTYTQTNAFSAFNGLNAMIEIGMLYVYIYSV